MAVSPSLAPGRRLGPLFNCVVAGRLGFSLVELLVAIAIVGVAMIGIGRSWSLSSSTFQQSRDRNNQEAAIDDDLATMEDLAFRYTCCPGSCTTSAAVVAASSTCKGLGGSGTPAVGSEYYYFPYYAPASTSTTNADTFAGSVDASPRDGIYENGVCHTGALIANLVTAMGAADAARLTSFNVTRSVSADAAALHRVRIVYGGSDLQRVVLIVPAVAAWCP